ncbi:MAG: putative zinc-binding protein, partial [Gammaproteobacteria bacterium]|nr:putative zinc-binding protein [Gammaproteobacteria bacterium]
EMSCIAGVGGGVPGLVKVARSGRPILALDGCKLQCTRHCLAREGIVPTRHIDLSTCGVKKRFHALADEAERARIWSQMILPTLQILHETKK